MSGKRSLRFTSLIEMPQGLRELAADKLRSALKHEMERATLQKSERRDDEHDIQSAFFDRLRGMASADSRYAQAVARTFAVPNGGTRSKRAAARLKREGVRAGVSDVCCAYPSARRHGLWLEFKAPGGTITTEQQAWIDESLRLGYEACVCWSAGEAIAVWRAYVDTALALNGVPHA
jgi:hypothetical protein